MTYSLVQQLVYSDWAGSGALRIEPGCSAAELGGARFLRVALLLLETARDEGSLPATRGGRLTRRCVRGLLTRMPELDDSAGWPGVLDEDDAFPLHIPRVVLGLAGLLVRRRGFRITQRGRTLLAPARIGELLATLFRTHFMRLRLSYLDRGVEHPHFQATVTYSLFQVGRHAADWIAAEPLAELAVQMNAGEEPAREPRTAVDLLTTRLLGPLREFGLVEMREVATPGGWRPVAEYRKTPLFDRFLRFEFEGGTAEDVPPPMRSAPAQSTIGVGGPSRPLGTPGPRHPLPVTARERDILLWIGIEDADLARRVRLPPVVDGWAMLALTLEELKRLCRISCDLKGPHAEEHERELRPLQRRMSEAFQRERELPDPEA